MAETLAAGLLEARFRLVTPAPLDVALSVAPNTLLALVGPSGAGKTTALRALAGLVRPADGVIRCAGETWFSSHDRIFVAPQDRAVGLVFQDYALFPHLTALDNVALAVRGRAEDEARKAARRLLARVRLEGLDDRRPHQLSGGERQRVAIARALARDPRVLLLDEPFSSIDRMTRVSLRAELMSLKRDLSIPIVLVTHDIDEAMQLADVVAVLDFGKTLQVGSPGEVRANPASDRVRAILGLSGT